MKYISTTEAAKKWGISIQRIIILAKEGRIPDAAQVGMRWMIPADAKKPVDGRTKAGKARKKQNTDTFRFPIFECRDIASFNPPLSDAEIQIKQVAEAFYACQFEAADLLIGDLPEAASDKYIRIHALYEGCMIDIFLCHTERFCKRHDRLRAELQGDFPHKIEMQEYLHQLDATLGAHDYYINRFMVIPGYPYHESFQPRLRNLCAAYLLLDIERKLTPQDLSPHELNCMVLESTHAYADAQALHIYLGYAYALMKSEDRMTYHFQKALALAEKYNLFFFMVNNYYYLRKLFIPALSGFSEEFVNKLESISNETHERYLRFADALSINCIYMLLTQDEYVFLFYAVHGYTNKEIAKLLHIHEGSVGKKYSEIYAAIGVTSKNEMIELYRTMVGKPALKQHIILPET